VTVRRRSRLDPTARGVPRSLLALAVVCALGAAGATTAAAASTPDTGATGATGASGATGATGTTPAANPELSANWAGYAISAAGASVRNFKRAAASWVEPTATCTPGSRTYSAFWVGLGGLAQSSKKLEQTGTEADCDSNGVAHYSAWYELVPAGPVTLKLAIAPGDMIAGSVSVRGAYVTMRLADETTGQSIRKRLHFPAANLSSAEWIAEAPSTCSTSCQALPLTDFGTVSFAGASVETGNGSTGTIASPAWSAQAVALNDRVSAVGGERRFFGPPVIVAAIPTTLDGNGSGFAVNWAQEELAGGPGGGRLFPGYTT
jgi:hypothetical protein